MEKKTEVKLQSQEETNRAARRLRREFLRYEDAEIIYSLSHKKLNELAAEAGAIYRMDRTVLINREIFDEYLERFREEPKTVTCETHKKR